MHGVFFALFSTLKLDIIYMAMLKIKMSETLNKTKNMLEAYITIYLYLLWTSMVILETDRFWWNK